MKGAGTEDSISPSVSGSCLLPACLLLPHLLPQIIVCACMQDNHSIAGSMTQGAALEAAAAGGHHDVVQVGECP